MQNQKIIAIVGPTASGKSKLALQLIKLLNLKANIISTDAFQIYKELNIGVNKPTDNELSLVKHYFINCCKINESWNIKKFQDLAKKVLQQLDTQKILPIVCGGSHLYIDALLNNYELNEFQTIKIDEILSNEQLYNQLYQLDPNEAIKITIHNRRRLIRAINICRNLGIKKSEKDQSRLPQYNVLYIFCNPPRNYLYEKINLRVEAMFRLGWIREVQNLIQKYPNFLSFQSSKAIGYNYIVTCIQNNQKIDLSEIKKMTRHLAKRQITWCKNHYKNNVINFDDTIQTLDDVINQVQQFLKM